MVLEELNANLKYERIDSYVHLVPSLSEYVPYKLPSKPFPKRLWLENAIQQTPELERLVI